MRSSITSAMVLGALISEAVASPTHAHMHRHAHEKKDVDWAALDWNNMGIDWSSAWAAGQEAKTAAPAVAATPTTAAAVVAQTTEAAAVVTSAAAAVVATSSSSSSSDSSVVAELWNDLVGAANDLTAFGESTPVSGSEVGYIGNVGYPIEGSNMIKVDSVGDYQFTNEFINTSGETLTVVIWNKAASQGLKRPLEAVANLGSCIAPETPALSFALKAGASQIVAFAAESVIGWAQPTSSIAESGAFATTWGEANFQTTGSGYDVSAIMNSAGNNYAMTISSSEAPACTSDMTQNMWLTASDPVGDSDGSCYIAQSTATLKTLMGGTV